MSKQISEGEVRRIAALARLGVTDEEVTKATASLQSILQYFSKIQAIDTEGVPTADDSSGLKNVTREDKAAIEVLAAHKTLVEAAPKTLRGHIKAKSVF